MKLIQFLRPGVLLFYIISCANNHEENTTGKNIPDTAQVVHTIVTDTFEIGKVISPILCKADPSESYALYIPSKGNDKALPVIYFFDPHGAGDFPLAKYKSLADTYGFIMVGSNNSKNGNDWPSENRTWNNLFNDTQKRLKINSSRIYVCGFSGGAKAATYIGLNHPEVKGVIANGAGLPDIARANNFDFSFTGVTGDGDMNMTDLIAINNELDKTRARHRIIFFNGIHEWAPADAMSIAFAGLDLDAMRQKLIPADDAYINNYISAAKKRTIDHLTAKNYIKAESECQLSLDLLDGLTGKIEWFRDKQASIKNDPAYQKQKQTENKLHATEDSLKTVYMQQFQQADMNYWSVTIAGIQAKAKAATAQGAMYRRLQAYLSLAFYSISNQLINSNRNREAQFFVQLYKMDDATNNEAWYFSAILNARNNNVAATENDLVKAVENGFTDKARLRQQPEFKNPPINFSLIETKMKN